MKPPRSVSRTWWGIAAAAALLVIGFSACTGHRPPPDPAYLAEVEGVRAQHIAELTGEDGWLTLVGLYWLKLGDNRFGADPSNEIVLPGAGVPPLAGVLELRPDATVVLHPRAGSGVTIDGKPAGEQVLRPDRGGKPDVVRVGPLSLYVIQRGGQLGLRVKDPDSPAKRAFKGIAAFPVDPEYRVVGTLERYSTLHDVEVASAHGPAQHVTAPGLIRFTIKGKACALEPYSSSADPTTYFIVFRDATAGHETYGAGRFLEAAAPAPGTDRVILDFNKAYNPPCAFTPYATCPLPTAQNNLPVRIEAGEKVPAGH